MLQRNTCGYPLDLPTLNPPARVWPGEEFEHHERLAGFTPVNELYGEPDTETGTETAGDKTVTSKNTEASGPVTATVQVGIKPTREA